MYKPNPDNVEATSIAAGAALLCAVLTQWLSRREDELCSELLCWIFLPQFPWPEQLDNTSTGGPVHIPLHDRSTQAASPHSLWIVAAGVAALSLCKSESNCIALLPTLSPLLLMTQRYHEGMEHDEKPFGIRFLLQIFLEHRSATMIGVLAALSLSGWDVRGIGPSGIALGISLTIYAAFLPRDVKRFPFPGLPSFEGCVVPLSYRACPLLILGLLLHTFLFGLPNYNALLTPVLGLSKAASWYCTALIAQHTSWGTAAVVGTFSILSTRNPFRLSSEIQSLSNVATALLSLRQLIEAIPSPTRSRSALWGFALVTLVPYLVNSYTIQAARLSARIFDQYDIHPVEALLNQGKRDFLDIVGRQSTDLSTASKEYRRKYGSEPPPGFDAWYRFAASHDSPIIDHFDSIHDSILPFRALSGKQVLETMTRVQEVPNVDLWLCHVSSKAARTECSHPYRAFDRKISLLFDRLLENVTGQLPDVKFLVNHIDEPRVLFNASSSRSPQLDFISLGHQPIWDTIAKHCGPWPGTTSYNEDIQTFGLPFVTNRSSTIDLCRHPEYATMHGLMMSPTSFFLIEGIVPVLSTGAPSTMGDILFPSPAYIDAEFQYDEIQDIEWDKKRNNLYWAGSTTGGYAADDQWQWFHRQRFVELAQNLGTKTHYYLRRKHGFIQRVRSWFLNGRLFEVFFTRIFQCESKFCWNQDAYFRTRAWAHKGEALRSKLVFDLDGNGISGRYYNLLASRSAPLKQTLLREWHDERLVPWLHYIPVSQGMEELPELITYLTSTEKGSQIAEEIANQGREWYSKAFREVDMAIYVYRLLLELARLQDPQREANAS